MTFVEATSLAAILVALTAFIWNVVRDLIVDRMKVQMRVSIGAAIQVNGHNTAVFADIGSLDSMPEDKLEFLFTFVNAGRRPIFLSKVMGSYRQPVEGKPHFFITMGGLPVKAEPYEVFTTRVPIDKNLIEEIKKENVKSMWVEDTTEKKWHLSRQNWKRLKNLIKAIPET